MFERTYEDASDPVHLHRDGLRFDPPAIAFVGQVLLLHRSRRPGDEERLLRFACAVGYGAAHGFKATLPLLKQIDDRLIACLMRGAFEGAIQPDNAWDISDEQKSDRKTVLENRIATRIREELDWLSGHGMEPTWPAFRTKRARTRPPQRLARDVRASNASTPSTKHLRVNYQRTALWLRQSSISRAHFRVAR